MKVATSFTGLALVLAAALLGPAFAAQAQTPPATGDAGTPGTPTSDVTPTPSTQIVQVVEVSQTLTPGASVSPAFTPPVGTTLVVTDLLLTNANDTPVCGVDLVRAGTAVTGGLCIAPRTTIQLGLVTGMEFLAGTAVELTTAADAAGPVGVHLRGVLTTATTGTAPGTSPDTGTTPTNGTAPGTGG